MVDPMDGVWIIIQMEAIMKAHLLTVFLTVQEGSLWKMVIFTKDK